MPLKDVTTTTFGLLIAYFVPGLTGLYAWTFWSPQVDDLFTRFGTTGTSFGLFLLVLMGALTTGMLLTPLKSLFYEQLVCRSTKLSPQLLSKMSDDGKYGAIRVAIDEQYRYHQCWGNMSIVLIPLAAGWLHHEWSTLSDVGIIVTVVIALLAEIGTVWAAIEAYRRYVVRTTAILS
jgi:hypothetical protein